MNKNPDWDVRWLSLTLIIITYTNGLIIMWGQIHMNLKVNINI